MTTLSVLKFADPNGADQALATLQRLQRQQLIQVLDAAVVTWPHDRTGPKTRQAQNLIETGALGGAFWGFLVGVIFFVPLLGLALGAGIGALVGAHADGGIDDTFIEQTRARSPRGRRRCFSCRRGRSQSGSFLKLTSLRPELVSDQPPGRSGSAAA